ncbi:MAG TPA: 2-isopropylmalate synthase [bacterium]|nr:2-isopropylmalate synthase [bacterium]
MDIVKIFDTTLRDGEQSPGCSMDLDEKLRMARQLAKLGVDIIEAGFPVASKGDFAAVQAIAREIEASSVAGLSRATLKDIDVCWDAIREAQDPRIHTFIATSDLHLKHKLGKSRDQVLKDAVAAVRHAVAHTPNVEFSAEDSTRSDRGYLSEVVQAVIEAGAKTINIPDTVGYTYPEEFYSLITHLRQTVPNIGQAVLSVHCHNDLGLAVANSLAAIRAGARQVECTVNGIGERAGNAAMEEIVMTLKVRRELFQCDTRIKTDQIYHTSKLLSLITGVQVQPNKAVVGENAFAHESGIHQDGMLKNNMTYEIMTPESVGWSQSKLVLGKHSGRHAFRQRLQELGYELEESEFEKVFEAFKALADKKKEIFDDDIEVILFEQRHEGEERYRLQSYSVTSDSDGSPKAEVTVEIDGQIKTDSEKGVGPVDASFKVLKRITQFAGELSGFNIKAITGGADAQGEVLVALKDQGREVRGVGTDTDIIKASLKAYLNALNRFEHFRAKREGV